MSDLLTVRQLIMELLEFNLDAKVLDDLMLSWSCPDDNGHLPVPKSKMQADQIMLCTPFNNTEDEDYD